MIRVRSVVAASFMAVGLLSLTALPAAAHGHIVNPPPGHVECKENPNVPSDARSGIITAQQSGVVAWDHCD